MSRPTRARGLKLEEERKMKYQLKSRPTRARGLKHDENNEEIVFEGVAPHAGAWIETMNSESLPPI